MATKEIVAAAMAELVPPLKAMGFKKHAGPFFSLDIAPRTKGWLSVSHNTDRDTGTVWATWVVGVKFPEIDRVYSELTGWQFKGLGTYHVGSLIGYLMPEHDGLLAWPLTLSSDLSYQCEGMLRLLQEFGIPFMHKHKNLRDGVSLMYPHAYGGSWREKLIIAYGLLGENEKALEALDYWLAKERDATYPAAKDFRQFAARFKERLSS